MATEYNVTSTAATGNGTLSWAIDKVNSDKTFGRHKITFSVNGTFTGTLAPIQNSVWIDGSTAPSYVLGSPSFIVNTTGIAFDIRHDDVQIKGLAIETTSNAIVANGLDNLVILDNEIGAISNPIIGISLTNISKCIVLGNTISNTTQAGISFNGNKAEIRQNTLNQGNTKINIIGNENLILENNISFSSEGIALVGNDNQLIYNSVESVFANGIDVNGNNNQLRRNSVLNAGISGIKLQGTKGSIIFSKIIGASQVGVLLDNAHDIELHSDTILDNSSHGIEITNRSTGIEIGKDGFRYRSVIGGNFNGIYIHQNSEKIKIWNTYIGVDLDGKTVHANEGHGIYLERVRDVEIGKTKYQENIISGNKLGGIYQTEVHSINTQFNFIGINSAGKDAVSNGTSSIHHAIEILESDSVLVKNNVINAFRAGSGVSAFKTKNIQIDSNYFGVDREGIKVIGIGGANDANESEAHTIFLKTDLENIQIQNNIISGNKSASGIKILGTAKGVTISRNFVGLQANGYRSQFINFGNYLDGMDLTFIENLTIFSNYISGNGRNTGPPSLGNNDEKGRGIFLGAVKEVLIEDNIIGFDTTLLMDYGNNSTGIELMGEIGFSENIIIQKNLIGNNGAYPNGYLGTKLTKWDSETGHGIHIFYDRKGTKFSTSITNVDLLGNLIGVNKNRNSNNGNFGYGVLIQGTADKTQIEDNILVDHGNFAVGLDSVQEVLMYNNRMQCNKAGIELKGESNNKIDASLIVFDPASRVDSVFGVAPPNTSIELYERGKCKTCYKDGIAEGWLRRGIVPVDALGNWSLDASLNPFEEGIVATITDNAGNTSAFSPCFDFDTLRNLRTEFLNYFNSTGLFIPKIQVSTLYLCPNEQIRLQTEQIPQSDYYNYTARFVRNNKDAIKIVPISSQMIHYLSDFQNSNNFVLSQVTLPYDIENHTDTTQFVSDMVISVGFASLTKQTILKKAKSPSAVLSFPNGNNPSLCLDTKEQVLVKSPAIDAMTYQWYRENGEFVGEGVEAPKLDEGRYYMKAIDTTGCKNNSSIFEIAPMSDLEAYLTVIDTATCENDKSTLLITNSQNDFSKYWLNPGFPAFNETGTRLSLPTKGYFAARVERQDCEAFTDTVFVEDLDSVQISITNIDDLYSCLKEDSVLLEATGAYQELRWIEDTTLIAVNKNNIAVMPGSYFSSIFKDGCWHTSDTLVVDTADFPQIDLQVNDTIYCENIEGVHFHADTANVFDNYFFRKDTSIVLTQNIIDLDTKTGEFGFYAISKHGCDTISKTITITEHPLPYTSNKIQGLIKACPGDTVLLHIDSANYAENYIWSISNATKAVLLENDSTQDIKVRLDSQAVEITMYPSNYCGLALEPLNYVIAPILHDYPEISISQKLDSLCFGEDQTLRGGKNYDTLQIQWFVNDVFIETKDSLIKNDFRNNDKVYARADFRLECIADTVVKSNLLSMGVRDLPTQAQLVLPLLNTVEICTDTFTIQGNKPTVGKASWEMVSLNGKITTASDSLVFLSELTEYSDHLFEYKIETEHCGFTQQDLTISRLGFPQQASLPVDTIVCLKDAQLLPLRGNTLQTNETALWKVKNANATLLDKTKSNAFTTISKIGEYTLYYEIERPKCGVSIDSMNLNIVDVPEPISESFEICEDTISIVFNDSLDGTGSWKFVNATGSLTQINDTTAFVSKLDEYSTNEYLFELNTQHCGVLYKNITVKRLGFPQQASLPDDTIVCLKDAQLLPLRGNTLQTNETALWKVKNANATLLDKTKSNAFTTISKIGEYTFYYEIERPKCGVSIDSMNLNIVDVPEPISESFEICEDTISIVFNDSLDGTGSWKIANAGGTLTEINDTTAFVSKLDEYSTNEYLFELNTKHCGVLYKNLTVKRLGFPQQAKLANDTTICLGSAGSHLLQGNEPKKHETVKWWAVDHSSSIFGNNFARTETSISYTGLFQYNYQINHDRCGSTQDSIFIKVVTVPEAPIFSTSNVDTTCEGLKVLFSVEKEADSIQYQWQLPSDYELLSQDSNIEVYFKVSSRSDQVGARLKSACGYSKFAYLPIHVEVNGYNAPLISKDRNELLCASDRVSFELENPQDFTKIEWLVNNKLSAIDRVSFSQEINTATEIVMIGHSNSRCAFGYQDSSYFTFRNPDFEIVFTDSTDSICQGSEFVFSSLLEGDASVYQYIWSYKELLLPSTGTTFSTETLTENGELKLSVIDSCGLKKELKHFITVIPQPKNVSIEADAEVVCEGSSTKLRVIGDGLNNETAILWSKNAMPFSTLKEVEISEEGSYTFVANNGNRCAANSDTVALDLIRLSLNPIASRSVIREGNELEIDAQGQSNYIYDWTFTGEGTIDVDTAQMTNVLPQESGYYIVDATHRNCHRYDSVFVRVVEDLVFMEVFTPNDDGVFDRWVIEGIDSYLHVRVEILNRWGSQVFINEGRYYTPWDGTNDRQNDVPQAVYYYVVDVTDEEGTRTYGGSIHVIR